MLLVLVGNVQWERNQINDMRLERAATLKWNSAFDASLDIRSFSCCEFEEEEEKE